MLKRLAQVPFIGIFALKEPQKAAFLSEQCVLIKHCTHMMAAQGTDNHLVLSLTPTKKNSNCSDMAKLAVKKPKNLIWFT